MADKFTWLPPPLTGEDERLVSLYQATGRSLDDLPYTQEFDDLVRDVTGKEEPGRQMCHAVFKQLLRLRKQGRLPRAGMGTS